MTYIAYYPYKKEVDGSKTVDDIKSKDVFAPQEDQTTEDLFRQSDILVWTSETGALRHINAELEHLYDLFTFHIKIKWKLVPIDEEGNPTFIGYVFPWDAADRINEKSGTGEKCFAGRHCIGLVVWVGKHEHDVYDYSHLSNLLEKRCHGYYNKKALGEFIHKTNGINWDNHPAANACRTYGEKCGLKAPINTTGWFLPSVGMINYVCKTQEPVETALKSYKITELWDERFAKIKDYIVAGEDPVYSGIEIPYIDDIKGFDEKETYWSSNEIIGKSSYAYLIAGTGTYYTSKYNQTYSQKPIAVRSFLAF